MVNFDVVHLSQFLWELIEAGRLEITGECAKRVTFHDPCYLGRHNGLYDPPRKVLQELSGLELVEMPDTREHSLCCGGGGGRIWMETPSAERFSDLRLKQAMDVDAEVLATCCPYCISNFEASRLTVDGGESLVVKDVVELIRDGIEVSG